MPKGYPRLAYLMSSDSAFMQFREFGSLHVRILLAQQQDIESLEEELHQIDYWDKVNGDERNLSSIERDNRQRCIGDMPAEFPFRRSRPEVLMEMKQRLLEYGERRRRRLM